MTKTKRHLGVDSRQVIGRHLTILPAKRDTFLLINVFMVSLIDFNFFLVVVVENV